MDSVLLLLFTDEESELVSQGTERQCLSLARVSVLRVAFWRPLLRMCHRPEEEISVTLGETELREFLRNFRDHPC